MIYYILFQNADIDFTVKTYPHIHPISINSDFLGMFLFFNGIYIEKA